MWHDLSTLLRYYKHQNIVPLGSQHWQYHMCSRCCHRSPFFAKYGCRPSTCDMIYPHYDSHVRYYKHQNIVPLGSQTWRWHRCNMTTSHYKYKPLTFSWFKGNRLRLALGLNRLRSKMCMPLQWRGHFNCTFHYCRVESGSLNYSFLLWSPINIQNGNPSVNY